MDLACRDSWVMDTPVKPSNRPNLVATAKKSASDFVYRFEVTYGLYVMDFWEKIIVYTILGLIMFFSLWKVFIPLSFACVRLVSQHLALEPKGFHSILERSSHHELGDMILGSAIDTSNITFNGTSHVMHL